MEVYKFTFFNFQISTANMMSVERVWFYDASNRQRSFHEQSFTIAAITSVAHSFLALLTLFAAHNMNDLPEEKSNFQRWPACILAILEVLMDRERRRFSIAAHQRHVLEMREEEVEQRM